tara:strand:+ start:77576 stop:78439 length:864 start_codon:yes stop_codon:yes gene_type:complete
MMEEMKMLNELFEKAKHEKPRLSYEKASQAFIASSLAIGGLLALKHLIINKLGLNTIIMISTSALISTVLIVNTLSTDIPENQPLNSSVVLFDSIEEPGIDKSLVLEESTVEIELKEIPILPNKINTKLPIKSPSTELPVQKPKAIIGTSRPKSNLLIIEKNDSPLTSEPADLAETGKSSQSFCIKNEDKKTELECIQNKLEKLGLAIKMNPDYDKTDQLEMLKLRIQHENGLDLKIKVSGFTTFAIMCIQDENGEVIALKYKVDEQDFSEVNMYSKTSYTYSKSTD